MAEKSETVSTRKHRGGIGCSVASCRNRYFKTRLSKSEEGGNSVSYYRFPKDPVHRKIWITLCGKDIINPQSARVCSEHFAEDDFEDNMRARIMGLKRPRVLKNNVYPTKKLDISSDSKSEKKRTEARILGPKKPMAQEVNGNPLKSIDVSSSSKSDDDTIEPSITKQYGGTSCAVISCGNSYFKTRITHPEKGPNSISYYCFPKDPVLRKIWINQCGRNIINVKTSRVCSEHFSNEDFQDNMEARLMGYNKPKVLKNDVYPTKKLKITSSSDIEDSISISKLRITCYVYGCENRTDSGFVMNHFPSNKQIQKDWLNRVKMHETASIKDAVICEAHFLPEMWAYYADGITRTLKNDAVPTLFGYHGDNLPTIPYSKSKKCSAYGCFQREGYFRLPTITLHKFPLDCNDDDLIKKWCLAVGNPYFVASETSYLCSDHFLPEQFDKDKSKTLLPGAHPTVYLLPAVKIDSKKSTSTSINIKRKSINTKDNGSGAKNSNSSQDSENIEEELENMGLAVDASGSKVESRPLSKNESVSNALRSFVMSMDQEDENSDVNNKSVNDVQQNKKRGRKRCESPFQPEPESLELDIKTDEDEEVVESSVGLERPSSATSPSDLNAINWPTPLKEEIEIKEEPESSLDSFTYNMLKDSAAECMVEVKLERLDDEMVHQYENAPVNTSTTKPFKKRFSVDNSEDGQATSPVQPKKRGRKKLNKQVVRDANSTITTTVLSKRRVVKPQKYKEFDCSFKRRVSVHDEEESEQPKRRKILQDHLSTSLKKESAQNIQKTLVSKKATKQVVEEQSNLLSKKEDHTKKGTGLDSPKCLEKEVGQVESGEKVKRKVGRPRNILKANASKDDGTSSNSSLVFNVKRVESLKQQASNKVSIPTTESSLPSPLTVLHGSTPITTRSSSNAVMDGGILVGVTPFSNTPSKNPVGYYSPLTPTPSNNFKLITNFEQFIGHLKERFLLESHVENFLSKNFSHLELYKLMRCKDNNKSYIRYSPLHKKFALCLHLFSSECYRYLNSIFSLPPESIIQDLMVSKNFQPGILTETLELLKEKISQSKDAEYCLVVDSVPIKKNVMWDEENDMFIGYTQLFPTFDYQSSVASQVVVLMISFFNENYDLPLAYFPVDIVYPDFLASIIKLSLNCIANCWFKPTCIVLDASNVSFSCAKILGCSLDNDSKIVSSYSLPKMNLKIPIVFDAHHLARLVRDWLSRVDIFSSKLGMVEWKYVQFLNSKLAFQHSTEPDLVSNAITALKLDSNVAEAIESQKNEGDTIFTCSKPTISFINIISKMLGMFDYYKNRFTDSTTKETCVKLQQWYTSEFCPYFEQLKVNSEHLKNHRKINFVNGFYYNINSLISLLEKSNSRPLPNKDLPKHKLTLDSIDLFYYLTFSVDNNVSTPDILSFKHGLEMYINSIKKTELPLEEIPPLLTDFRSDKRSYRFSSYADGDSETKKCIFYIDSLNRPSLKIYKDRILMLISNVIKENILKKITCENCLDMLNHLCKITDSTDHNYTCVKWQKKLALLYKKPSIKISKDVYKIVQVCSKVFDQSKYSLSLFTMSVEDIIRLIVARTKYELFENLLELPFSQFNHPVYDDVLHTTHENYLTTLIIKHYVQMRIDRLKPYFSVFI